MNRVVCVVALGLAAAVAGCGSSSTKTVTVTSTSAGGSSTPGSSVTTLTATGTATLPPGTGTSTNGSTPPLHLSTFESPTGNIGCIIAAGLARCDIQHRSWAPGPRPATCPHIVNFGQGLEVGAAGLGRLVCAGDTAIVPSGPRLPYGRDTAVGPFRCVSYSTGMNCLNDTTGHGFFMAIQSYRVF